MAQVQSGLELLVAQKFAPLLGKRVGLVTHSAAVDAQLRNAVDVFAAADGVQLVSVFGPEHGLHGQAQDLIGVSGNEAKAVPAAVTSLYGTSASSLRPTAEQLGGLDVLVVDLQDIGSRFYTFQATMRYCLEVALPLGLSVLVLDRPNPLGGLSVEGPAMRMGYESFVGAHDIAIRHGLTSANLRCSINRNLNSDRANCECYRVRAGNGKTCSMSRGCRGSCPPRTCPRWTRRSFTQASVCSREPI